jgi:porphobilinogen synthase
MENYTMIRPVHRMRRLRHRPQLRAMIQETQVRVQDLVLPLFIKEGNNICEPILSLPGHFRYSVDRLDEELKNIKTLGIPAVLLFGVANNKDPQGRVAFAEDSVVSQAIKKIKTIAPELLVITDLCFCGYTDHGHCGVLVKNKSGMLDVQNDETLSLLAKQAVHHAEAGADIIAPSGMMDGMVHAIRTALDAAEYSDVPILSYAVKYSSSFYGPFREAAQSSPQFGDRKSYQMDPSHSAQALREASLDVEEGADMLMVKPAQNYLDVIYRIKQKFPGIPLAAYQVSGEYSMIKAAAEKGWLDENAAMQESLMAIKRAGADFIITYFAKEFADCSRDSSLRSE